MNRPKHIDVMKRIDRSPFRDGRKRLPPSKWAELMRAIAEDLENDDLDEAGKQRCLTAIGRAAVEMEANERQLNAVRKEITEARRGKPQKDKGPSE